jgi:hypothetical protein
MEGNEMEEINDEMSDTSRARNSASCSDNAARLGWSRAACSAAQAECLCKVRDEKTYRKLATN